MLRCGGSGGPDQNAPSLHPQPRRGQPLPGAGPPRHPDQDMVECLGSMTEKDWREFKEAGKITTLVIVFV